MRYLITFSYDGTNFHGFEKQDKYRTIQGEIEDVLKYINNGSDTKIVASGRTDKGVHALEQNGHVDINVKITEDKLKRAMNSLLKDDIHVIKTEVVSEVVETKTEEETAPVEEKKTKKSKAKKQ